MPLTAVVTSPLQRCLETTELMLAGRDDVPRHVDERVGEVRYGDWSGEKLKKLAKDPLWKVVQSHPSAMTFPGDGGEAMRDMQVRAVDGGPRLERPSSATTRCMSSSRTATSSRRSWPTRSGMHLDQFQRIVVDPASVSIVTLHPLRPFVVRANDGGGDLSFLAPPSRSATPAQEGGGRLGRGRSVAAPAPQA